MLILVSGLKGAGKDCVGDWLVGKYAFNRISFASVLKDVVAAMFNWNREALEGKTIKDRTWREKNDPFWSALLDREITPRLMLQEIGTDIIRKNFDDNFWIYSVLSRIDPQANTVITDVRFTNEITKMKGYFDNVISLGIVRPPLPNWYGNSAKAITEGIHKSEYSMMNHTPDFVIVNNRSILDIYKEIDKIMEAINERK